LRCKTLLSILTVTSLFCSLSSPFAETLKEVLRANGVDWRMVPISNVEKDVTSHGVLNDSRYFCMAYSLATGTPSLPNKLNVARYDKSNKTWSQNELNLETLIQNKPLQPGSVARISQSGEYLYLDTHINPSAGRLLVLSNDLKFHDTVDGWSSGFFKDGTMVYHHSQVHFAATHSVELSIYNPRAKTSKKIYPLKPYQGIRLQHIRKVKEAYAKRGENWFREHNHPMDPELFNCFVSGTVITNDNTHSLAFVIGYDNKEYWSDEEVLKLESFRELRKGLENREIKVPLPDDLFGSLAEDLLKARRSDKQEEVLDLLRGDRELCDMLEGIVKTDRRPGEEERGYLISLNKNWENPEVWKRLAQRVRVPEEVTEVVYICRNVKSGNLMYKELLLEDVRNRFGDKPLSAYLEPGLLDQMFGR
jgi:hypothetical protein